MQRIKTEAHKIKQYNANYTSAHMQMMQLAYMYIGILSRAFV